MKVTKKISTFLCNFLRVLTRPQRKHFLVYLVGLIWIIKFRSIREIALQFGEKAIDSLHHFIKETSQKTRALYEENQEAVTQIIASFGRCLLIIDDTPCPRDGAAIEGSGFHHSPDGLVRGLCAVTAIVKVGAMRLMWALRGYRPKKSCAPAKFKSKIQLALEILQEAKRLILGSLTVLIDTWYGCAPILNCIAQAGWTFLSAIKRNRILIVDGIKTRVWHLAKGRRRYKTISIGKKKRFKVAKRSVYLPKVGEVLLFISKTRTETRFFVTNDLSMTEAQMIRLYSQRFWIETFHRDIKQYLGFGELFMRSWEGVQKHWTLVGIAYNLLVLWNAKRSGSLRQISRRFRKSFSHESILNLHKRLSFVL